MAYIPSTEPETEYEPVTDQADDFDGPMDFDDQGMPKRRYNEPGTQFEAGSQPTTNWIDT